MDAGNQTIPGLVEEQQVTAESSLQSVLCLPFLTDPATQEINTGGPTGYQEEAGRVHSCGHLSWFCKSARPHGLESAVGWRYLITTESTPWLCWPTGTRSQEVKATWP